VSLVKLTILNQTVMDKNQRDLFRSIFILGAIVIFAIIGLIFDRSWLKAIRISIALSVYCGFLFLVISRLNRDAIPVWPFLCSAAAAEMASGWLRPEARNSIHFTVVAAGMLIGLAHWIGLRLSSTINNRIRGRFQKPM
jgi:DNA segregation ATPase FtsK/SpoIIIE-like protein